MAARPRVRVRMYAHMRAHIRVRRPRTCTEDNYLRVVNRRRLLTFGIYTGDSSSRTCARMHVGGRVCRRAGARIRTRGRDGLRAVRGGQRSALPHKVINPSAGTAPGQTLVTARKNNFRRCPRYRMAILANIHWPSMQSGKHVPRPRPRLPLPISGKTPLVVVGAMGMSIESNRKVLYENEKIL